MTAPDDRVHSDEPGSRDSLTLALLVSGDQQGLRQLLEDHGGVVRGRLRRNFGKMLDDSELDEAMGLCTIRVWQAAARFDAALGTLRAWFSVIARNCALRILVERRRRALELRADMDQVLFTPAQPTPPTANRKLLLADAHACLYRLPFLQRAVLLADLEAGGAAPAEALAQRLCTSPNSIYVSRLKGLRALRKALERVGHGTAADPSTPQATRPEFGTEQA